MRTRNYTDLVRIGTYEDRFRYLALGGSVGASTFGFDRYINQQFYRSRQWRQIRQYVIARDEGLDLAVPGYEINSQILIHHMNPIDARDIELGDPAILDPEFLITTTSPAFRPAPTRRHQALVNNFYLRSTMSENTNETVEVTPEAPVVEEQPTQESTPEQAPATPENTPVPDETPAVEEKAPLDAEPVDGFPVHHEAPVEDAVNPGHEEDDDPEAQVGDEVEENG